MKTTTTNTNTKANENAIELNAIENLIATANLANEKFDDIPSNILKAVEKENNSIISENAKTFITLDTSDFYKSIMLVDIASDTKEKELANTIYNAISVKIYVVSINDNGLLELSKKDKALTIADFYKAKLEMLSFKNADLKPTKKDRIDCNKYFFGVEGFGLIQCITASATKSQKLSNMKFENNADLIKAYAIINEKYLALGKENPFDNSSNTALANQLKEVFTAFVSDTFDKKINVYHYQALFQMIAHFNKKGVFVIENALNVLQALTIVARYIHNNKHFTIQDKAKIFNK